MMNKHRKILGMMAMVAFLSPLSALTSCSDWNDHYENASGGTNTNSLFDEVASHEELSDFSVLLAKTKVFRHHKMTETSYADILSGGQSLTLMAPVNGTFNLDSLLTVLETAQGDSAVEHFVVKNHIIRSPHSAVEGRYKALNGKYVDIVSETINGVEIDKRNIQTRNGILHVMKAPLEYKKTIYETLVLDEDFKDVGSSIASYNEDIFDENASVSSGSIDGVPVYIDSVIYERNRMLEAIGLLNAEDSVYTATIPTNDGWNRAWNKAVTYFNYADDVNKRDSLQKYNTMRALLDDAIFSKSMQSSPNDSIISVQYNRSTPEYHVFYKPFESTGLLGKANSTRKCSNGVVYCYDEWPFDPRETFFKKIEQEGEYTWNITFQSTEKNGGECSIITGEVIGKEKRKKVHKGGYTCIEPSETNGPWKVTYKIPNVLSGKYNVHVVTLPEDLISVGAEDLPVKYKVSISYYGQDGKLQEDNCGNVQMSSNQGEITDLIVKEGMKFPVCLYGGNGNYVTITLTGNASKRKTSSETSTMYLDYIYLEPVIE